MLCLALGEMDIARLLVCFTLKCFTEGVGKSRFISQIKMLKFTGDGYSECAVDDLRWNLTLYPQTCSEVHSSTSELSIELFPQQQAARQAENKNSAYLKHNIHLV